MLKIKLKEIRQQKGMTLKELSLKTGISKSELNNIELGYKYPRIDTFCTIVRALELECYSDLCECDYYKNRQKCTYYNQKE